MLDLLPAPALGLLTNALAVPGMVLGSILETSALPALGDSPSSSSSSSKGDYIQPSASSAGAHARKDISQACLSLLTGSMPYKCAIELQRSKSVDTLPRWHPRDAVCLECL